MNATANLHHQIPPDQANPGSGSIRSSGALPITKRHGGKNLPGPLLPIHKGTGAGVGVTFLISIENPPLVAKVQGNIFHQLQFLKLPNQKVSAAVVDGHEGEIRREPRRRVAPLDPFPAAGFDFALEIFLEFLRLVVLLKSDYVVRDGGIIRRGDWWSGGGLDAIGETVGQVGNQKENEGS